MKYAGMISLIISSTSLGLLLSKKSRQRVAVCKELSVLCDMLCIDLGYTVTPITQLINKLLLDERLKNLGFITEEHIKINKPIESCLSNTENTEISQFLYSLGKSDVKSQIKRIQGFKEYINGAEAEYDALCIKNSKLYVSFGFFSGVVISLILL